MVKVHLVIMKGWFIEVQDGHTGFPRSGTPRSRTKLLSYEMVT